MNIVRTSRPVKSISTALIALLVLVPLMVAPVAAQEVGGDPDDVTGDAGTDNFEGILNNMYDVVMTGLRYVGLIALAAGGVLYFTARKNSDRAENGMKIGIGGAALTLFYFGMNTVIGLLEYIAGGA